MKRLKHLRFRLKIYLIFGISFLAIIGIIFGLIYVAVQTQFARNIIREKAANYLTQKFQREVWIGKIEGNALLGLKINGFKIAKDDSISNGTMVDIETLDLNYDLWSLLINRINIHTVKIVEPEILLQKEKNDKLNVENIINSLSSSDTTSAPPDTTDSGGLGITIDNLEITDGKFRLVDLAPFEKLKDVTLSMSVKLTPDGQISVHSRKLSTEIIDFPFDIENFSGYADIADNESQFRQLILETKSSKIRARGKYNFDTKAFDIELNNSIIATSELFGYIDPGLRDEISGVFRINGDGGGTIEDPIQKNISFNGKIRLSDMEIYDHYVKNLLVPVSLNDGILEADGIEGTAFQANLRGLLRINIAKETPNYLLDLNLSNFNLREFDPSLSENLKSNISGDFYVKGKGFSLEELTGKAKINLSGSTIGDLVIDTLVARIDTIFDGEAHLQELIIFSKGTSLKANGYLGTQFLDLKINTSEIKINKFTSIFGMKDIYGTFNLNAVVQGAPGNPDIIATIFAKDGRYKNIGFDRLEVRGNVSQVVENRSGEFNLRVDSVSVDGNNVDFIKLEAQANQDTIFFSPITVHQNDTLNLTTELIFIEGDSALYFNFVGMDLSYYQQSLVGDMQVIIEDNAYSLSEMNLRFGDGKLQGSAQYITRDTTEYFESDLTLEKINIMRLLSLSDYPHIITGNISADLSAKGSFARPEITLTDFIVDSVMIALPPFDPANDEPRVTDDFRVLGDVSYRYPHVTVDSLQCIYDTAILNLDGKFPINLGFTDVNERLLPNVETDVRLDLEKFPLALTNFFIKTPYNLSGYTSLDFLMSGTLNSTAFEIKNLEADSIIFGREPASLGSDIHQISSISRIENISAKGHVLYENQTLNLDSLKINYRDKEFFANGELPINLNILTDEDRFESDNQITLDVNTKNMDLRFIKPFTNEVTVKSGTMDIDVHISGTMNEPQYQGEIQFKNGLVAFNAVNIDLREIRGNIDFDKNEISLSDFQATLKSGKVMASGTAEMDGWTPKKFNFSAEGDDILLIMPEYYLVKGKCDVKAQLIGTINKPILNVDLNVTDQTILSVPFGQKEENTYEGGNGEGNGKSSLTQEQQFTIDIDIQADRNFWVRNNDINIEVSADLNMRIEGDQPIFSGTLQIRRGTYYFIDKKFEVVSGEFYFENTTEISPQINLKARNIVEGGTEENDVEIILELTGTLEKPQITVHSPTHPSLTEQDIILLLSLNISWQQFKNMDREGLFMTELRATAQGYLEAKLAREARKLTPLDVIELDTRLFGDEDSEKSIRVTVGKYVSKDVFISYSRDLLSSAGQKLKVDYFLNNHISLEGETDEKGDYSVDLKFKYKY